MCLCRYKHELRQYSFVKDKRYFLAVVITFVKTTHSYLTFILIQLFQIGYFFDKIDKDLRWIDDITNFNEV